MDNNPLKLHDPDGAEIKVVEKVKGNTVTYHIQLKAVLIDSSTTKIDQKKVAAYQAKLVAQIQSSYQGKGKGWVKLDNEKDYKFMNIKWDATASIRVVSSWSEVQKDDHVFRIVDRTQNNSSGDTHTGAMLINLAADIFQRPTPDQFDKVKPIDPRLPWSSFHQPEGVGAHEFGHAAGLSHADLERNLMTDGQKQHYKNIKIDQSQIRTIVEAYKAGRLNQRDADLDALTKTK